MKRQLCFCFHVAICAVLSLAIFHPVSAQQLGRVLYVNKTDTTCNGRSPCYSRIQAAIDVSTSGDTIRIQPGTYPEQLNIQKNDFASAGETNRIIIEADPESAPNAVILSGSAGPQCTNKFAIRIRRSKFVTIRGLTITGTGAEAIFMMGGNNGNQGINIVENRIYGNGSISCNGGITIARGNPDTLIVNNLIHANGQNGIALVDDGGPNYIINNTVYGNQWNGVSIAPGRHVLLVNNIINQNGTVSGTSGGRFGVHLENWDTPTPERVHLLNNLSCGNRLGDINGPVLDSTDSGNLSPEGIEGLGFSASAGCQDLENVFSNAKGADGIANTIDDDFRLSPVSPAIDRGIDSRTLGLSPLLNPVLEADYYIDLTRPRIGKRGNHAQFDIGAHEYMIANQSPVANAGQSMTVPSGTIVSLNGTNSFDPDGDSISHHWTQTAGPSVTISNPTAAGPVLTAPTVQGLTILTFQLTVSDGLVDSSASVDITVTKPNQPPVLSSIGDRTVTVGSTLQFTVSASDLDDDPLIYSVAPLPANATFDAGTRVFAFTPIVSQVGSFSLTVAVSDGKGGAVSESIRITVTAGLAINITTPTNGATVPAGQLIVRGSITNPSGGEIGLTVNGVSTAIQQNAFVGLVFVSAETTSLTAIVTSKNGTSATQTIPITVLTAAPSSTVLHVLPTNGPAPLTATFSLFGDVEVRQVILDANGDGNVDFTGQHLTQQSFTFAQPGIYVATANATDLQGNQLAASTLVQVLDQTELDGILQARWLAMKDALRSGDIPAALSQIVARARPSYEEGFQIISAQLPSIDEILTSVSLVRIGNNEAVYKASRNDDGIPMSFEVRFAMDVDGFWRVASF
ncbi:MAG TPA: right-handed parallel beta-helix repeat-containing protein [Candidatus Binatia bacterium]|nr:right-handed parallel beta-helix repeat-containing protein [Candidatus Binatia bacterium]